MATGYITGKKNIIAGKKTNISGSVNVPLKFVEYTGVTTDTAETVVNNGTRKISVNVNTEEVIKNCATKEDLNTKANLVNGKVPASELPSYVDDVLEFPTFDDFPEEGESGVIYVAIDTGHTYRWSGSEYIEIGGGLEIIPVSDETTVAEIPDDFSVLQYNIDSFFVSNNVKTVGINKRILSLQNHEGVYSSTVNANTTLSEFLVDANYSPYTMTYISKNETPENEKGLYRYIEVDEETDNPISSHIVEVVKEDHSGGEVSLEKTTTSNNTQLNSQTFMSQFSSELSTYINVSNLANVYSLYYSAMDVPFNGIRIGTKNVGTIELNVLQECDVVIYKYFSYNAQTGVKNYDTNAEFIIDGATTYQFEDDDTPVTVTLSAGNHTISSGGQNKRVVLTAFKVDGNPYSTFEKKELARTEDVEEVQDNLDSHIVESTARFIADEKSIKKNADDITLTNSKIGDIQIYQVVSRLPQPSEQLLNKIYRYNEVLYQCVKTGDGVHKEFIFNVSGTSEIVYGNQGRTYQAFMNEVGNEFKKYYEIPTHEEEGEESGSVITVLDAEKLFRNNGSIRLGSGSALGRVSFNSISDLPVTSLKIGVKAYRDDKPSCIYIEDDYGIHSNNLVESSITEKLINVSLQEEGATNLDFIYLDSLNFYTDVSGDEPVVIECDNRVVITRLIADFGDVSYMWKPVSSTEMTYEQTMNILRGIE